MAVSTPKGGSWKSLLVIFCGASKAVSYGDRVGQSVVELESNATPGFVLQAGLLWLDSLEAHALQIRSWVCGCVGVWVCGCVGVWV